MSLLSQLPPPPPHRTGWPWDEAWQTLPDRMPDGREWPKVSIVTPSYNQMAYLEETIRSVLLQDYPNLEYIIVDGASNDGSIEIIEKYAPWLSYWGSEPDNGQAHAINKGFARATGEIFGWLNSDDIYLPGALSAAVQEYVQHAADFDVFVGDGQKVDLDGNLVFAPRPHQLEFEYLLDWGENQFSQPACFFSKAAWQACGPLSEHLNSAIDLDLWLRMARQFQFKKMDHLIAQAKAHDRAKTSNRASRLHGRVEAAIILLQNGGTTYAENELHAIASELGEAYEEIELLQKGSAIYRLEVLLKRLKKSLFSKKV